MLKMWRYPVGLFEDVKESKSLSSKIFDILREDILSGKYRDGEKIIESKVAQELGISRTPVREAIKKLELEGLVENHLNRGNIVTTIKERDIEDIFTLRIAIERITTRWSVERISDEQLQKMAEIVDLMEFYMSKKDKEKFFELNTAFHEIIYKAACAGYLEHVLKDFQQMIKNRRKQSLQTEGRIEKAYKEHREILDAFLARDVDRACEVLVNHITTAGNF